MCFTLSPVDVSYSNIVQVLFGFYLVGMCLSNEIFSNFFLCIMNCDSGIFLADILALCTGMRSIITIDYGGKMPELHEQLCALLKSIQKISTSAMCPIERIQKSANNCITNLWYRLWHAHIHVHRYNLQRMC